MITHIHVYNIMKKIYSERHHSDIALVILELAMPYIRVLSFGFDLRQQQPDTGPGDPWRGWQDRQQQESVVTGL